MSLEEIRVGTQGAWDRFYSWRSVWARSRVRRIAARRALAFVLISKLYRQMYANTGIATDSARVARSARWAQMAGHGGPAAVHRRRRCPISPCRRPAKAVETVTWA